MLCNHQCKCFTNGVPVLYAETRESGSDEVAGLQRKKQASIPIYRKFSRVKSYADAFFVPFYLHMSFFL